MNAYNSVKGAHPEEPCCDCIRWARVELDWGECSFIARYVPESLYRRTYAYSDCAFEPTRFIGKPAGEG